jgi:CDP-diacylglycerol---serine O-phosphatidyltransferase
MKKFYLVPNVITAFGLACGLFVIFKVNMVEVGFGDYEVMTSSAILILIAAVADFVDGAVARVFKVESDFGLIFDSVADAISFGVAPVILVLKGLSLEQGTMLSFICTAAAMVYSICGVLRLVRFSVKSNKIKSDILEIKEAKKNFTGLPIPIAAIALVSINLLLISPYTKYFEFIGYNSRALILICIMFVLGYFMVSRWKFPSIKGFRYRLPSFQLAFVAVVFAVFTLYGLLYFFPILITAIPWIYITLAIILSIIRLIAGKKSKTLLDYEPAEDEEDKHE